ncbi:MAG: hypothetical protein AUJ18_00795 [Candidatus Hydrogenedentes bacterium CG1_02_42_14]|nr:MAG: hypothetical protein AUJ18_00795 [Candidatus Hydrogenedentes bacterium CG1_02_42_14]
MKKFVSKESDCAFCHGSNIVYVTNCFDTSGKKICELWFCNECSGFFPRMLTLPPPGKNDKIKEKDKRKAPRFPVQFVIQVDFHNDNKRRSFFEFGKSSMSEPIVAMVLDAGFGGLCFRYSKAIEEGSEGRMLISLPSAERSFMARAKVVRCMKLPDQSFGLGVQFVEVDPDYRDALKRYVELS